MRSKAPNEIDNLQDYACALMRTCLMLMTASKFHEKADNLGLLNEIELEKAKAICWQTNNLFSLIKSQLEEILDRTGLQEQDIFNMIKAEYDR